MSFENLLTEQTEGIVTITINRPKQLNALNKATISELSNALLDAESDKSVRVIILTGSGEKAFVAGADIKEFADFNSSQGQELSRDGQTKLFNLVENLNKPVIAAVNGFALGGGLELAMACHIRVVSDNAKMGLPEVSLGVIPGYGGTQRLPQLVGKGKASEMIMTGMMMTAEDAKQYGLANHICYQNELLTQCCKIAIQIMKNSPNAIAQSIKAINEGYNDGVNGFEREIELFGECFGTEEMVEGTTAFLEKRKARF